ncbi:MAG: flagellin [Thiotrichaceae bacterium]|nr:MAG: flagellin [Thiotrichaceae bacterium]
MALTINTNVASLNAQRNLSSSSMNLATSLERLSSGLRINSAKDDAAGLAISERMTTQIRGMNVAMRNASDGVSLAQTAEGSLDSVSDALQRIRELAVQSANATNSDSDRAALNAEAQQLKSEVDRVATQTNFNGVKLLDGSFTNQTFQVGANAGETIAVSGIVDAKSSALGTTDIATQSGIASTANAATLVTGTDFTITNAAGNAIALNDFTTGATAATNATAVAAAINEKSGETGVFATIDSAAPTVVELTSDHDFTTATAATAAVAITGFAGAANTTVATVGFDTLDLSTAGGANLAIQYMDSALTAVNTARADLGAIQTRFESVVNNLAINSENTSAARGRILDADFALETANLTKNQILQQAGTAMLAQANQIPQNVLSLLR